MWIRARKGNLLFPLKVDSLFSFRGEQDEPPWNWSSTLLGACIINTFIEPVATKTCLRLGNSILHRPMCVTCHQSPATHFPKTNMTCLDLVKPVFLEHGGTEWGGMNLDRPLSSGFPGMCVGGCVPSCATAIALLLFHHIGNNPPSLPQTVKSISSSRWLDQAIFNDQHVCFSPS